MTVHGLGVDAQTRCAHWRSARDVVALRFRCCGDWYSCYDCHAAVADHDAERWPVAERDARAVLCGACGHAMTIAAYLAAADACPRCAAGFNPGCRLHHDLYFEPA